MKEETIQHASGLRKGVTIMEKTNEKEKNYFEILNDINVNDKIEKKNNLSYLSWAFAWGELKKRYPESYYTIYETSEGWNYFTDGRTGWVKTGVTVVFEMGHEREHIEYLPIMDFRNKSITLENITSFDVNKAIQRSLTKAVARHGLGLYIYAGEDLPEDEKEKQEEPKITKAQIKELTELVEDIPAMLNYFKVDKIEDITKVQAQATIDKRKQ